MIEEKTKRQVPLEESKCDSEQKNKTDDNIDLPKRKTYYGELNNDKLQKYVK